VMVERGMEIRIMVPRFGIINERKNRLHEVVRLSGINISVGDDEKPLTIKVASIPTAKLQVYFIDNEDYFQRKSMFLDKDQKFHADNADRAIFFCKGVLETVKKLGWSPDIIHCNDWMTGLIPMYLKTAYKNDPAFKEVKSIFTFYNTEFSHRFNLKELLFKVRMNNIDDDMLKSLSSADFEGFVRIGAEYADKVFKATHDFDSAMLRGYETIEPNDSYADAYQDIYFELLGMPIATAVGAN
jgi:starch synthase